MNKYARPLILVLALVALGAATAALDVHYHILKDPTYAAVIGIFIVSGGISMSLGALPSRFARDLKAVLTTPLTAVLALVFVAGSASLVAFFPKANEQTVTAASGADDSYVPPTETI